MIHAYLQEIGIQELHGPNFKAKMKEINCLAGSNIAVKHNYMKWWRCTGTCRTKQDKLFGYVLRLCTETPGPNDPWWKEHSLQCCGSYIVSSEPDKKTLQTIKRTYRDQKKSKLQERLTKKDLSKIPPDNEK